MESLDSTYEKETGRDTSTAITRESISIDEKIDEFKHSNDHNSEDSLQYGSKNHIGSTNSSEMDYHELQEAVLPGVTLANDCTERLETIEDEDEAEPENSPPKLRIGKRSTTISKPKDDMASSVGNVKRRKYIHNRIKCEFCDHTALHNGNLKVHISSKHMGATYPCDKCKMTFKYLSALKGHIERIHEEIRYPCDQCVYQATQKQHLKEHIRWKHDGIKLQCDTCGFEVNTKTGLHEHMQFKHQEKTFLCFDDCSFVGSSKSSLKQHLMSKMHEKHRNNL